MKIRYLKCLLAAGMLAHSLAAQAEDIDVFTSPPIPANVLIIVDNTANWELAFENEMRALFEAINSLEANKFRVGLVFANQTGNPNNNVTGGYVRAALRLMNRTNKPVYLDLINSFDKNADKGNAGISSLVMAEAYRYLSGGAPYGGNYKVKTDYSGNTSGTAADRAVYALAGNALGSFDGSRYNNTPFIQSGCEQKNTIIYISNGKSNDSSTVTNQSTAILEQAGGDTTTISLPRKGYEDNPMDEWARFMKANGLGVTTYTIDVDRDTTNLGLAWSALLKSTADVSDGGYFDVRSDNPAAIADILKSIFEGSEIQDIDSGFASVSLPGSTADGQTLLNQVFVTMFRPDKSGAPRWSGNLKQYKLGYDANNVLGLLDAAGERAISTTGTGFIAECARSYWTPTSVDTYWDFKPRGGCPTVTNSAESNTPDGDVVEKGGQAYWLRGSATPMTAFTRTVKTCSPVFTACTELTAFDTDNTEITQALLDPTVGATNRNDLINWGRGLNVDGEGNATYVMRPSIHGDVIHSVPLAINYGTDDVPQIVVYYGGNDGMLRAVNGNRSSSDNGIPAGGELWSFMAPQFYPHIKRLRDNTTPISFVGALFEADSIPQPKPYGFDGPLTAYKKDAENLWLYASMRRGGRAIYAFDVATPSVPTLKWKNGCPNPSNDVGCTTGFQGIGQTWAAPGTMKAAGYEGGLSTLLVMGGGYDKCEDNDPHTCTGATKGNKVYVLDAEDGALVRALDTERAVIGEVFVINDSSGLAKFGYVSDLGGNVYRINFGAAPADWTITKIASLGCASPGTCAPNRKFMFAPDVVEYEGKYVLLLGSGDREKPLMDYTAAAGVSNYFFMLKDDPSDPQWLTSESTTCGSAVICLDSLYPIGLDSTTPTLATVAEKKGWYLSLNPHEQVVTSALTIFGTVYFSTHVPVVANTNECTSNLGTAFTYKVFYANAAGSFETGSRAEQVAGGGLPASPVGGMVKLDNGETVPFVFGGDPDSPLEGGEPEPPRMVYQPKSRVYWHIQP